jgi:cephalosporin hydroxylase
MDIKSTLKSIIKTTGYELRNIRNNTDLSVLRHIHENNRASLSDAQFLESDLLLKLGLNNELMHEMPEELAYCSGKGLYYWQYPNQLSKYLTELSKYKISSYLEIGVRHGGTFIITVEYISKFSQLDYAIGVDIEMSRGLPAYILLNKNAIFMLVDSKSAAFKQMIKYHPGFDLVFIDGDHEESACQNDFNIVKDKANICVLHDITSDSSPGPGVVWNRIKSDCQDEYYFFEFTEQYESVLRRTGKRYLGIGMAVKKSFHETNHSPKE